MIGQGLLPTHPFCWVKVGSLYIFIKAKMGNLLMRISIFQFNHKNGCVQLSFCMQIKSKAFISIKIHKSTCGKFRKVSEIILTKGVKQNDLFIQNAFK